MNRFRRTRLEQGFTLIELLVVMVIIGVLAAIALPNFLRQKEKAYVAAEKNDLRTYATAMESNATDTGGIYSASQADAVAAGFTVSNNITVAAVVYDVAPGAKNAYCLQASSTKTTQTWYLDSMVGSVVKGLGANCSTVVTP